MDPKTQFQKDAIVLTANGQQVGHLSRVVVNPETNALTDILVRVGILFSREEKVIPIEFVAETTGDGIVLHHEAGLLESFPSFEEKHLIDTDDYADQPPSSENALPTIFGHADLGMSVMESPPNKRLVSQITQNIPDGSVAMKKGAGVVTAEGYPIGNVERVLADPSDDRITHLMVSNGLFMKAMKLIPIQWVTVMDRENIHLRVKRNVVEELAEVSLDW
jgi:uncharacterized protein YrrD